MSQSIGADPKAKKRDIKTARGHSGSSLICTSTQPMPTAAASHVRTHMAAITVAAILNRMVSLFFFFFLFVHASDKNADPVPDFSGFKPSQRTPPYPASTVHTLGGLTSSPCSEKKNETKKNVRYLGYMGVRSTKRKRKGRHQRAARSPARAIPCWIQRSMVGWAKNTGAFLWTTKPATA